MFAWLARAVKGLKILVAVLFIVAIIVAIYFINSYFSNLGPKWCSTNRPDAAFVTEFDADLKRYYNQCGMVEACNGVQSTYFQTEESVKMNNFEVMPTSSIDSECNRLCTAFDAALSCVCKHCSSCHEYCGLSRLDRCKTALACGRDDYRVFPAPISEGEDVKYAGETTRSTRTYSSNTGGTHVIE